LSRAGGFYSGIAALIKRFGVCFMEEVMDGALELSLGVGRVGREWFLD